MRSRPLAGLPAALSAAFALASITACGPSSQAGRGGGEPPILDGGVLPCVGTLTGLSDLVDAGFACTAALIASGDGGGPTSFAIATVGDLPAPVIGVGAVVTLAGPPPAGGAPPAVDGGVDGGLDGGGDAGPDAGSFAFPGQARGSATVQIGDGRSFGLDSTVPTGSGRLSFSYVADAGAQLGDTRSYQAHGTLDARLPFQLGPRQDAGPDGGPFDGGSLVLMHLTF